MKHFNKAGLALAVASGLAGSSYIYDAHAATTANTAILPQTPNRGMQSFVAGTDATGTYKTVYTAAANGSKCVGLIETNNDGGTHLITVAMTNGTITAPVVAVTTAANDGNANATPSKNFFSGTNAVGLPVDSDGNPFLFLKSGDSLVATYGTTATTSLFLLAICADY